MDKRSTGIIATVVAAVLCGCPGLVGLCFGSMFTLVSQIPGADIDVIGSNDPGRALAFGLAALCLSLFLIAIPVVVGFLTLRNKPAPQAPLPPNEPLPPAI